MSISGIGYSLAGKYGCFDGCYELTGKPQNFIMRCVCGGRCMLSGNKKQIVEGKIQDFDAVSLYPSAMKTMLGVPKGKPKIIPINEPFNPIAYDTYFIEISIDDIDDIYDFPLVFDDIDGKKTFANIPIQSYYCDKTTLLDLIEFYPSLKYTFKRGYYFDEGFNTKINTFITNLFDLRKRYKEQKNPLEKTIKLLLNSIYGKSILKALPSKTIGITDDNIDRFVIQHQNSIVEMNTSNNRQYYVKLKQPIHQHYNLPQFGVMVLSQSKHIMNKVMCLAEQNGIKIYYQDTDSIHILDDDITKLSLLYKNKYGSDLIGQNLTQFHSDFQPINGLSSWSIRFIGCGKKSYLDVLTNECGDIDYHIRLKGIPDQVIKNYCKDNGITVEELYLQMYNGKEITFDLLNGSTCFRKNKTYHQYTPTVFTRKIQFD
jgi:hypothetical protein